MSLSDYIDEVLPAWMRRSSRAHWLALSNTVAHVVDAVIDGLYDGRLGALPGQLDEPGMAGFESADALPYLGRDRRLVRGPSEDVFTYAARLRAWRSTWRTAGTAAGVLGMMRAVMSPAVTRLRVVSSAGVWWTLEEDGTLLLQTTAGTGLEYAPDGTVTPDSLVAHAWNWDGVDDPYRIWPIIYAPTHGPYLDGPNVPPGPGRDGQYGDGLSTYGKDPDPATGLRPGTIGTTAPRNYVEMMRGILSDWKPLGMACSHIIVTFDPSSFDPASAANMPDGNWSYHGKSIAGVGDQRLWVRARFAGARYWKGVA